MQVPLHCILTDHQPIQEEKGEEKHLHFLHGCDREQLQLPALTVAQSYAAALPALLSFLTQ